MVNQLQLTIWRYNVVTAVSVRIRHNVIENSGPLTLAQRIIRNILVSIPGVLNPFGDRTRPFRTFPRSNGWNQIIPP